MSEFGHNPLPQRPLRFRAPLDHDQQYRLMLAAMLMLSLLLAIAGMVGGFIYGDAYGRKHAQYDNPTLREYYAGQCYAYWESQFRRTVRETLDPSRFQNEQTQRLDELRMMLQDMRLELSETTRAPQKPAKKRIVSSSQEPAS